MSAKEWFVDWFDSPFYHKLYFERDEKEAEAFIRKLVDYLHLAKESRVLDVGCGRGRHSKVLASLGYDVTGIDLSPASIEYAKQFESGNLRFFIHDMRYPFWGNYFDLAVNLFTSFGYFRTRREHDGAMRSVARSIKPNGIFVIDYLNTHYAEERLEPDAIKELGTTVYTIHKWQDESHFYKNIKITDPSLKEPAEYTEKVNKFSLGDFTEMLAYQGLQAAEVFGDYDLGPYDVKKTPRLIIVARRGSTFKGLSKNLRYDAIF